jgi:outer membrane biosynthesis protein TonB
VDGFIVYEFVTNEEGEVTNLNLHKSLEYNVDNEVQRVLKKTSGKWVPEISNGKKIKTSHVQTVNYINNGFDFTDHSFYSIDMMNFLYY